MLFIFTFISKLKMFVNLIKITCLLYIVPLNNFFYGDTLTTYMLKMMQQTSNFNYVERLLLKYQYNKLKQIGRSNVLATQ